MKQKPAPTPPPLSPTVDSGQTFDHEVLRASIAAALDAFTPAPPVSAASMVVDLKVGVKRVLQRGGTLGDVARIMSECGLPTTADAVRVGLRRDKVTRVARARKAQIVQADTKPQAITTKPQDEAAAPDLLPPEDKGSGLHLD